MARHERQAHTQKQLCETTEKIRLSRKRGAEARNWLAWLALFLLFAASYALSVAVFKPSAELVCGRSGCASGTATGAAMFLYLLAGAVFYVRDRAASWRTTTRPSFSDDFYFNRPKSPYGSRALHRELLSRMGLSRDDIERELRKYRY